jgi:hypothetical protein
VNGDDAVSKQAGRALDQSEASLGGIRQTAASEAHIEHVRRKIVYVEHHAAPAEAWKEGGHDQEIWRRVNVDDIDRMSPVEPLYRKRRSQGKAHVLED